MMGKKGFSKKKRWTRYLLYDIFYIISTNMTNYSLNINRHFLIFGVCVHLNNYFVVPINPKKCFKVS